MPAATTQSTAAGSAGAHPQQQAVVLPLTARVSKLVLTAQFLWFLGHLATVTATVLYLFFARGSPSAAAKIYARAYYGTLLSYGIIMYKAHGIPQINTSYLQAVLRDENTQYFLLALIWAFTRPFGVSLIPYAVFSLFHSLNYFRSELLPTLLPASTSSITPKIQDMILRFVRNYQSRALRLVAYAEVFAILPWAVFGILWGATSFVTALFYVRFLAFRNVMSPLTKQAFGDLRAKTDAVAAHPVLPAAVKKVYATLRDAIVRWGDMEAQARAQNAPAPAR
ncbi:hypothetical protein DFS34DRAFT_580149 [Phlyctochytrium arcticum]|nr:hypothetical protein DFS34DRAFT_91873 [Phlyctochytrium arcticum]KAI9098841.1 hypothetical protein DFS34DRAFT_580149 [Phlyctochytrium arcticum]